MICRAVVSQASFTLWDSGNAVSGGGKRSDPPFTRYALIRTFDEVLEMSFQAVSSFQAAIPPIAALLYLMEKYRNVMGRKRLLGW